MAAAPDPLEEALGAPPPPGVAALPARARARLAGQVEDAKRRHRDNVTTAVERALREVPMPVRGVVRKAIRG